MPAGGSGMIGAAGLVRLRYAVGPPRSAPDSAERVMQPFPAVGEPSLDSRRLIAAADRPEEAVEGVSPDAGSEHGIGVAVDPRDAGCSAAAGGQVAASLRQTETGWPWAGFPQRYRSSASPPGRKPRKRFSRTR